MLNLKLDADMGLRLLKLQTSYQLKIKI